MDDTTRVCVSAVNDVCMMDVCMFSCVNCSEWQYCIEDTTMSRYRGVSSMV